MWYVRCICVRTEVTHLFFPVDPRSTSFDLSKATKLRDVVFRPKLLRVDLRSRSSHQNIGIFDKSRSMSLPTLPIFASMEMSGTSLKKGFLSSGWTLDLDHTLVHLWESLSICTNVIWPSEKWNGILGNYLGCLLPEMAKRGMVTVRQVVGW